MRASLALISLCLLIVVIAAAAAGIFERSAIPVIIIAFALVIGLGAAPVIFSARSRRSATGGARCTDDDVIEVPVEPFPRAADADQLSRDSA